MPWRYIALTQIHLKCICTKFLQSDLPKNTPQDPIQLTLVKLHLQSTTNLVSSHGFEPHAYVQFSLSLSLCIHFYGYCIPHVLEPLLSGKEFPLMFHGAHAGHAFSSSMNFLNIIRSAMSISMLPTAIVTDASKYFREEWVRS